MISIGCPRTNKTQKPEPNRPTGNPTPPPKKPARGKMIEIAEYWESNGGEREGEGSVYKLTRIQDFSIKRKKHGQDLVGRPSKDVE